MSLHYFAFLHICFISYPIVLAFLCASSIVLGSIVGMPSWSIAVSSASIPIAFQLFCLTLAREIALDTKQSNNPYRKRTLASLFSRDVAFIFVYGLILGGLGTVAVVFEEPWLEDFPLRTPYMIASAVHSAIAIAITVRLHLKPHSMGYDSFTSVSNITFGAFVVLILTGLAFS
jgi:hypothetical protein